MAAIPQSVTDPVVSAIFAAYVAKYWAEPQRPYLGASIIGRSCKRALWYSFRWAIKPSFDGRMYRLFQSGHLAEPRFSDDLRAVGCTVYETDPTTGGQFAFVDTTHCGGHLRGHCDGIAINVPGAGKQPLILEYKTHSAKSFKKLTEEGVKKSKPEHYAQCQLYMRWSIGMWGENGCRRALYLAVNKDTDELHSERIEYSAEESTALIQKAQEIIYAVTPPEGISQDPTWYECRFCDHANVCHGTDLPAPTCRSCAHVTPEDDGDARWSCQRNAVHALSVDQQRKGCDKHLYIPVLFHKTAVPVDGGDDQVIYRTADGKEIINGNGGYTSQELNACKDKIMLTNDYLKQMREQFNGTVVA